MIDRARLSADTFELVSIPSPTGDTRAVAEHYGSMLEELGMRVELVRDFPSTPTVIARLDGGRPGPRVVLNGHLDTVPIPHQPARLEPDAVHGRGAADMKGAMACGAEVVRVLQESGEGFPGELVIVGIGLHEAPSGRGEDLTHLVRERGFTADAVILMEGGRGNLPLAHMGAATFEITVSRPGIPTHELMTEAGTPHPIVAAGRVIDAIGRRREELAATEHPLVGSESYFIGEVHGGDFYNRFPTTCRLVGTRRWAPGATFDAVHEEFEGMLRELERETGCQIALDLRVVRPSYRMEESQPLVQALQAGYAEVTGAPLPVVGMKTVADAPIWVDAGIPAVYHGPAGMGAHADVEYMPIDELVKATRVFLATLRHLWSGL